MALLFLIGLLLCEIWDVLVYIIAYDAPKIDVSRETMCCRAARATIVLFFLIVFYFDMLFAHSLLRRSFAIAFLHSLWLCTGFSLIFVFLILMAVLFF